MTRSSAAQWALVRAKTPSVPIYGSLVAPLPKAERAPRLDVDPDSVAGRRLSERLCQRIAGYMQNVMTAQTDRAGRNELTGKMGRTDQPSGNGKLPTPTVAISSG